MPSDNEVFEDARTGPVGDETRVAAVTTQAAPPTAEPANPARGAPAVTPEELDGRVSKAIRDAIEETKTLDSPAIRELLKLAPGNGCVLTPQRVMAAYCKALDPGLWRGSEDAEKAAKHLKMENAGEPATSNTILLLEAIAKAAHAAAQEDPNAKAPTKVRPLATLLAVVKGAYVQAVKRANVVLGNDNPAMQPGRPTFLAVWQAIANDTPPVGATVSLEQVGDATGDTADPKEHLTLEKAGDGSMTLTAAPAGAAQSKAKSAVTSANFAHRALVRSHAILAVGLELAHETRQDARGAEDGSADSDTEYEVIVTKDQVLAWAHRMVEVHAKHGLAAALATEAQDARRAHEHMTRGTSLGEALDAALRQSTVVLPPTTPAASGGGAGKRKGGAGAGGGGGAGGGSATGKDPCKNWNNGKKCAFQPCGFAHVCSKCGSKDHAEKACPIKKAKLTQKGAGGKDDANKADDDE